MARLSWPYSAQVAQGEVAHIIPGYLALPEDGIGVLRQCGPNGHDRVTVRFPSAQNKSERVEVTRVDASWNTVRAFSNPSAVRVSFCCTLRSTHELLCTTKRTTIRVFGGRSAY